MSLFAFTERITFRFLQPPRKLPEALTRWLVWHPRMYTLLERMNTCLPAMPDVRVRALWKLGSMPRLSTMSVGAIVNEAVARMPSEHAYVNVGVWHGFTLLAGMVGNPDRICIGVDDFSQFGGPRAAFLARFNRLHSARHAFHDEDYRAYFAHHQGPIGVYYYDGEHGFQNQLLGLRIAEPFFVPGTIVIIDDVNWDEPRRATEEFLRTSPHSYDVLDMPTACDRHPTFWNGIMLLRRK